MQVSVVIPVYNAAPFVTQAVESALQQPETGEVILIEDGSPDNALEVCRLLEARYDKVHLFRHPDGRNHGAGASRNLGMQKSSCEFIAFLDADDYYLPGRFSAAKAILASDSDCDGVYEAVGHHVQGEDGLRRWAEAGKVLPELTTMSERVRPEDLWRALMDSGRFGYFHLDGLVLRRSVLRVSGHMAEGLRLHQDTEFMLRVAVVARLQPGRLEEPVARVRVHGQNRISASRTAEQKHRDRMLMWMELYRWCRKRRLGEVQMRIMHRMVKATTSTARYGNDTTGTIARRARRLQQLIAWFLRYPRMMIEPQLWLVMNDHFRAIARKAKEAQTT